MALTRRDVHPTFGYIAITLAELCEKLGKTPMRPGEALKILEALHLSYHQYNLVKTARQCCGMPYCYDALTSARPQTFDCSTLIKFIYAHAGLWLPRFTYLMVDLGETIQAPYQPGDLLFTAGKGVWRHGDYPDGIGHVAMATSDSTCIHTDNADTKKVIEMPITKLRQPITVAKRLLPNIEACQVISLSWWQLWVHSPTELEALIRKHLQANHRPRSN